MTPDIRRETKKEVWPKITIERLELTVGMLLSCSTTSSLCRLIMAGAWNVFGCSAQGKPNRNFCRREWGTSDQNKKQDSVQG